MKKMLIAVISMMACLAVSAQGLEVKSPDGKLRVVVDCRQGNPTYVVSYDGQRMIDESPLGLVANIGDFSRSLRIVGHSLKEYADDYQLNRSKVAVVNYRANELTCSFENESKQTIQLQMRVSNNDIALRYLIPKQGETASVRIMSEATGFCFPEFTTTFITPQSEAMIGWKRTKPSYEEEYKADAPMTDRSQFGHGYTFPCLFHVGDNGWVLVSETGVDSRYCGSHLSDYHDGMYTVAMPMAEENNGNGTVEPAFSLPGATPWRTITVASTLRPIVETTAPWDNVAQLYDTTNKYRFGRGTWSWILWQDGSINYDDQTRYIDLASAMGFEYVLVDNWWDTNIGTDGIEKLVEYARTKNVEVFLWYSSSGYWNDIEQGPINRMDRSIERKRQMRWMREIGVKGIKVDFFGGDKQETIGLYEEILSDADDHGLMVIFHGCTIPRGWERMYPNYAGSEAVLASENLIFDQHHCDIEAFSATLHPFIRNAVGCMEYGGCFMNKRMNRGNDGGNVRRTTDVFELATTVLFQNPIQNFAIAPNNLTDAPAICMDYLREIPTTWDETRFIDGYPGKYVVLARRHGETWYVAAVNAMAETLKLDVSLDMFAGKEVKMYYDGKNGEPQLGTLKVKAGKKVKLTIQSQGGVVIKN